MCSPSDRLLNHFLLGYQGLLLYPDLESCVYLQASLVVPRSRFSWQSSGLETAVAQMEQCVLALLLEANLDQGLGLPTWVFPGVSQFGGGGPFGGMPDYIFLSIGKLLIKTAAHSGFKADVLGFDLLGSKGKTVFSASPRPPFVDMVYVGVEHPLNRRVDRNALGHKVNGCSSP